MILIDALTYNADRHYNNFGILKDNTTNEFIKFAPIYDNGLGLFSYLSDYSLFDTERLNDEIKAASISNWNILHTNLLLDNINDSTLANLIKMKNYRVNQLIYLIQSQ